MKDGDSQASAICTGVYSRRWTAESVSLPFLLRAVDRFCRRVLYIRQRLHIRILFA